MGLLFVCRTAAEQKKKQEVCARVPPRRGKKNGVTSAQPLPTLKGQLTLGGQLGRRTGCCRVRRTVGKHVSTSTPVSGESSVEELVAEVQEGPVGTGLLSCARRCPSLREKAGGARANVL